MLEAIGHGRLIPKPQTFAFEGHPIADHLKYYRLVVRQKERHQSIPYLVHLDTRFVR